MKKSMPKDFLNFWKVPLLKLIPHYPTVYGDTLTNLKAAAAGENEEWTILYPKFADIAEQEGFAEIA